MSGKETGLPEMEKLFEEASYMLQPLYGDSPEGFNHVEFSKKMREIKGQLNTTLKKMGLFDKNQNSEMKLNPKYADLLWALYEAAVTHSAQGNFQMQLNAYLEIHDAIKSFA